MKYKSITMGFLVCALWIPLIYAENSSIDALLIEANTKHAQKDYEGAAMAYKQILDLDVDHREARVGLAAVLMHAQKESHFSDESDALKALLAPESTESLLE